MALHIYDGLNWIRQAIESNNFTLRQLYMQLAYSQETNIIVWEGKGGNERRRKFYAGYKRNRVRPSEDIFRTIDVFRELLTHTSAYQIAVPTYEGDDVVASLVTQYKGQTPIWIHSTDKDFRQLACEGVHVDSNKMKACEDKYVRLYKTLVGDPSDSIKGLPGFGEVAFGRLDCAYVLPFFERKQFGTFLPEFAFMDQKHFNTLQQNLSEIGTYWHITGFFEIPLPEMALHMQKGTLNSPAADALMRHYLIN